MEEIYATILTLTGASSIDKEEVVQELWSSYGHIIRYHLHGGEMPSVILKQIHWPEGARHPKGWNTNISHERKLRSYKVEKNWYLSYAHHTDKSCRTPTLLHASSQDDMLVLILEDLNAAGYFIRHTPPKVKLADARKCLSWLANFHARFMGVSPEGLWPIGTYWHLGTRPDEWDRMQNMDLKRVAQDIDKMLSKARYHTLVHGDAKLANFCFHPSKEVAAVDFQYVGGGCGIKDVAYFIGSCFKEDECEDYTPGLLKHYFQALEGCLDKKLDFQAIQTEWSRLYKYAWADFYRFLDGWSPGHWKMHGYSENIAQEIINELT